ncbi:BatD family protein [Hyunsoonleella aestuarii]|uniref:Protein BatD n=1 Tax=Hyunsoonleella aestuarii TaxID=912802 RepID=A0ABP8E9N0_9FLAO|nr:BatD family protein [Hyunsoonleella aestuarii]
MEKFYSNISESRNENQESKYFGSKLVLTFFFVLVSWILNAQVSSTIDSTSIKIGEQITYTIQVETDTTSLVVFPEGQAFSPLEMIESYKTDTLKDKDRYNLIKKYGLTQFDSGAYTIPRQKIIVGDKTFFTDSLQVEVNNVLIDTTKQGLYDIKPIIEVKKKGSDWWKYLLIVVLILGVISFLLYWFIWRQKPLTEEEQIAMLPPYDRAKLALKKLDESHYLEHQEIKEYYSELTFIIRKYLDEKVYDRALESTTDELISRLRLLKDGNQVDISKEDIKNLESILKRADLVKFAKSSPDIELAKLDRNTIDVEIDHVKEALPEPTEEEKLLDEKYREDLERKKKRKKIIITVVISVLLLIITIAGFSIKYGFNYVKDTIIGHDSIELLEGEWVTSEYGFPPITISTPKVLKRTKIPVPDEVKGQVNTMAFSYGTLLDVFSVMVNTTTFPSSNGKENTLNLEASSEGAIKNMEAVGAKDIVVLRDKFSTPNGAEGLKTSGTMKIPGITSEELREADYVLLQFASENVLQQIIITSPEDDVYADRIVEQILNSVELKPAEE